MKTHDVRTTPLAGTRELVGAEAEERRGLVSTLLGRFANEGYALVRTPIFDVEDVFQRGPGLVDARDYLRFVESETGASAVLRPDITPQIARIVATRYDKRAFPLRFAYAGIVFRRTIGRAKKRREIEQIGAEFVGEKSFSADEEILRLAVEGCRASGLTKPSVALSHAALGKALVERFPESHREALVEALSRRDLSSIEGLLSASSAHKRLAADLRALLALRGDDCDIGKARQLFGREGKRALDEMDAARATLAKMRGPRVAFDFDEVRGLAYYTGLRFGIFAHGPGEAVGGGGRYDELVKAHGLSAAAVGFALDAENLALATRGQK
jgi:ATP phosphoribosyltransferase regulatory subunit